MTLAFLIAGLLLAVPTHGVGSVPVAVQRVVASSWTQEAVDNPAIIARRMKVLRREGKHEQALQLAKKQPMDIRADTRVIGQRIQATLELRRFTEAKKFVAALQIPKKGLSLPLAVALVRTQYRRGDLKGAREGMQKQLDERPGNLDLRVLNVRLLLEEEDFAGARAAMEALPTENVAWLMGELAADYACARGAALMADEAFLEEAVELLEAAVAEAPHRGDLRSIYVQALLRFQRIELAEEQVTEGLRLDEDAAGVDRIDLLLTRGTLLRSTDRVEEATACFEEVLGELPHNQQAQVGLARCRSRLGDRDGAVAILETCIARRADSLDALLLLAEIEEGRGDLPASEAALRKVLAIKPNHLKGCWRLSRVLARQGELDEVDELVARYEARKKKLAER